MSGSTTPGTTPARVVLGLLTAVVLAGLLNAGVAMLGHALGVSADFGPFRPTSYLPATVIGVAVGAAGWSIIRSRSSRPARMLAVAVPVAAVVSLSPDLAVLLSHALPGATGLSIGVLMCMHVVLVAVLVPTLSRVLPVRATAA